MGDAVGDGSAGQVVVLVGAPGTGKTRLARLVAERRERRGWRRVVISPSRSAQSIPFGCLAPILEGGPVDGDVDGGMVAHLVSTIATPSQTTLLLVDDLPLLDDGSATVVSYLAGRPDVVVVATARSGEQMPEPLRGLFLSDEVERVELGPLTRDDHEELLSAGLGGPVEGRTSDYLWQRSRGNPLFLRELVLGALEEGALVQPRGLWRLSQPAAVPLTLADVLRSRHDDLDDTTREAAELVAMAGPLPLAEALVVTSASSLEVLEHRGLIEMSRDGDLVSISHPLHADLLRDGIGDLRRRRLASALAHAVEVAGLGRPDSLVRAARWRVTAGDRVPLPRAVAAARAALMLHDLALAEALARHAHEVVPDDATTSLLGEVLAATGQGEEAERLWGEWEATDPNHRCFQAINRAETLFFMLGRATDALQVLADASRSLTRGLRREVDAELALLTVLGGDPRGALALCRPELEAGGRVFVKYALAAAPALVLMGRADEGAAMADEGLRVHAEVGDDQWVANEGMLVVARIFGLTEAGRLDEAGELAAAGYNYSLAGARTTDQAWMALQLGRVALARGRTDTAIRLFDEGAELFADLSQQGARRWCLGCAALACGQAGDESGARAALAEVDRLPAAMAMMEPDIERARAWVLVQAGRSADARAAFVQAAELAHVTSQHALEAAAWHDLIRIGAWEYADDLSRCCASIEGPLAANRIRHATALAERDVAGLLDASTGYETLGALLFAAEAAAQAGRLADDPEEGDRARSTGAALLERCGPVTNPALNRPRLLDQLSARELDVVRLAARALTNRDVAERLGISVRTAENHLQRAYRKLGVTDREALARVLGWRTTDGSATGQPSGTTSP